MQVKAFEMEYKLNKEYMCYVLGFRSWYVWGIYSQTFVTIRNFFYRLHFSLCLKRLEEI